MWTCASQLQAELPWANSLILWVLRFLMYKTRLKSQRRTSVSSQDRWQTPDLLSPKRMKYMKQEYLRHWLSGNKGQRSLEMGNKGGEPYSCSSLELWKLPGCGTWTWNPNGAWGKFLNWGDGAESREDQGGQSHKTEYQREERADRGRTPVSCSGGLPEYSAEYWWCEEAHWCRWVCVCSTWAWE